MSPEKYNPTPEDYKKAGKDLAREPLQEIKDTVETPEPSIREQLKSVADRIRKEGFVGRSSSYLDKYYIPEPGIKPMAETLYKDLIETGRDAGQMTIQEAMNLTFFFCDLMDGFDTFTKRKELMGIRKSLAKNAYRFITDNKWENIKNNDAFTRFFAYIVGMENYMDLPEGLSDPKIPEILRKIAES